MRYQAAHLAARANVSLQAALEQEGIYSMFGSLIHKYIRLPLWLVIAVSLTISSSVMAQRLGAETPLIADNGMVIAAHPLAVAAGFEVLQDGGNAVDAAVAVAAVLGVVHPHYTSLGGNGFALIYDSRSDDIYALDMNGLTPSAAAENIEDFTLESLARGASSFNVPGNIAGWDAMLKRFGSVNLGDALGPAIKYAERGAPLGVDSIEMIERYLSELIVYPTFVDTFLVDGEVPGPTDIIVQADLARTMRQIASEGVEAFYRGSIAEELVRFSDANGGYLTMEDLAHYEPQWKTPLYTEYRDYTLVGQPPASTSVTWMEILKLLEGYDLSQYEPFGPEFLHLFTEATKLAYFDGFMHVGDTDFPGADDVSRLLEADYIEELRERIDPNSVIDLLADREDLALDRQYDPTNSATAHMIVADRHGNVVSMTNTIGQAWGAGMPAGETGVFITNGMDWIDVDIPAMNSVPWSDEPSANALAPLKRPRWTLSPGMILKDGRLYMAIGSSGGEMTQQQIALPLTYMLDYGMNVQEALVAPRVLWRETRRYTSGNTLYLDAGIPEETRDSLAALGHEVAMVPDGLRAIPFAVTFDPETGVMSGGWGNYAFGWALAY